MKIKVIAMLLLTAFLAVPSSAAIRYSFQQRTRSDIREMPSVDVTGHTVIDDDHTRVDFVGKGLYGERSYIVSSNALKRVYIVDPQKKTITDVDLSSVTNALAAARIEITNMKSDLKKLPGQLNIAGFPTDHYRLETSYDMTVMFGNMPLTQNVRTVVEKWTTSAFGDVTDLLGASLYQTGNSQLDAMIESETVKMTGLPLRQRITVTTGPTAKATAARRTIPTRKQTSELLVTEVKMVPSDPSLFTLPAGYQRLTGNEQVDGEALHNLTLTQ